MVRKRQVIGEKYFTLEPLGSGGNADVWLAKSNEDNSEIALKILKADLPQFKEKCKRFRIETQVVLENQASIGGIVPILDYNLPSYSEKFNEENQVVYWYTMPVAQPINEKLKEKRDIVIIVDCILDLAKSLELLHKKGIVHRDIKPSNIYFYNHRYCFGDFGLVDYPEKEDLTSTKDVIGAKATIAPEMKWDAKNADGKKADIYSITKTLWMLLTKSKIGFEGKYLRNSCIMGLKEFYPNEHLVELEVLIEDSTNDEPALRPDINEFIRRLSIWKDVYLDFDKSNLSEWKYIQESLFKNMIPDSAQWTDRESIILVLNLLGSMPNLNHMFVPNGGGIDFSSAEIAAEEKCIAINCDSGTYIVKPKKLIVENVSNDYIWSYFRLELDDLNTYDISTYTDEITEELVTEYMPGKYIHWIHGNYGYYDEKKLLKESRLVTRILKGTFVFFAKSSVYNKINGTYDERHNKYSAIDFRNYIEIMRMEHSSMSLHEFIEKYNKNPFGDKERDNTELLKKIENEKRVKELIKDQYKSFDFLDICNKANLNNTQDGCLVYTIEISLKDGMYQNKKFIGNDGRIYEQDSLSFFKDRNSVDKKYIFNNFVAVLEAVEKVTLFLLSFCETQNLFWNDEIINFSICLHRKRTAKHMFTKEEIKKVLQCGNDYKSNVLVIDGEGYPLLIEKGSFYELYKYPVRHESYGAYNNYVGKYSKLNHLEETYITSLQGWLSHLENGGQQYMDYLHDNNDENELLEEIGKFYK